MRDPIQYYENKIEDLLKVQPEDYKSTVWKTPEEEIVYLRRELEKVNRMIKQGVKF